MTNEDLTWDRKWDKISGGNPDAVTLQRPMVEEGRKLRELTLCFRSYSIAYNKNGCYGSFGLGDNEPLIIETNGYTEPRGKGFSMSICAPSDNPYDVVSWFWSSRRGLKETKNEWSYFRKSKQNFNAQEWHHVCVVYSVSKKNTGMVFNGEILANRNQTDLWATEDNFYGSQCFEPFEHFLWEDGNEYNR